MFEMGLESLPQRSSPHFLQGPNVPSKEKPCPSTYSTFYSPSQHLIKYIVHLLLVFPFRM